jgi:hypothetical protein
MSDRSASFLDALKNPEYTGGNRCVPCTIANALIAVVASVVVSLAVPPLGVRPAVASGLGVVVLALSALLIYLRGYLVPGTPELTKRYLPERVLGAFGKHPLEREPAGADGEEEPRFGTIEKVRNHRENKVDPEVFLEEAGILTFEDGDPEPTRDFATRSGERIETIRDGSIDVGTLSSMFEVEEDDIEAVDREYPAYRAGSRVRTWISEGARLVDVATYETLAEQADGWENVPFEQRLDIVEWLRGFQDDCPYCGGDVRFNDDVFESCCGRFQVTIVACADCGERFREFDPSRVGSREERKGITP